MVANVTALGRSGLFDWVWQRVSAVVLAVYVFTVLGFFFIHPKPDYFAWCAFFMSMPMRLFSVVALFSLLMHAWIGMWTVMTDYVKCTYLRVSLTALIILSLIAYFFWGVFIFWRL